MGGTKAGAQKALATMKKKYGENYYSEIGTKGGSKSARKGFAVTNNASELGTLGAKVRWSKKHENA